MRYLIFAVHLVFKSAIDEGRGLSVILRKSSSKQYQIMMQNLTAMMTLLGKPYMMKNISGNVSREGSFLVAQLPKEMKNIIGMKTMLKRRKKKTKKIP